MRHATKGSKEGMLVGAQPLGAKLPPFVQRGSPPIVPPKHDADRPRIRVEIDLSHAETDACWPVNTWRHRTSKHVDSGNIGSEVGQVSSLDELCEGCIRLLALVPATWHEELYGEAGAAGGQAR